VVLVAHEENVAPRTRRVGGDLGKPLEDRALEIELQHHAPDARQAGVHADWEGKWFAAAKDAKLFDEAVPLANRTPCDPKTPTSGRRRLTPSKPPRPPTEARKFGAGSAHSSTARTLVGDSSRASSGRK